VNAELWDAIGPVTMSQLKAEVLKLRSAVDTLAGELGSLREMVDAERSTSQRMSMTPEERRAHKREYMRGYMRERRAQRV